jgi:hypothetical protein
MWWLELPILLLVAAAGYAGAPWWFVPLGGAALTMAGWWVKLRRLCRAPRVRWSNKFTAYLVTGVLGNICLAALSYAVGSVIGGWTNA